MDFGHHFSSENDQSDPICDISDVPHRWIVYKGSGSIGHDRQHTYYWQKPQYWSWAFPVTIKKLNWGRIFRVTSLPGSPNDLTALIWGLFRSIVRGQEDGIPHNTLFSCQHFCYFGVVWRSLVAFSASVASIRPPLWVFIWERESAHSDSSGKRLSQFYNALFSIVRTR